MATQVRSRFHFVSFVNYKSIDTLFSCNGEVTVEGNDFLNKLLIFYSVGVPCNPISIIEGLKGYVKNINHASGCRDVSCNSTSGFAEALSIAKKSDYVIIVAGIDLSQETEDHDRYSLLLPGYQTQLVTAVAAVSKKPVILVLTGGGPLDVSFAVKDPRIGSIVWIGYPGETGGTALSQIIFGHYNPGRSS